MATQHSPSASTIFPPEVSLSETQRLSLLNWACIAIFFIVLSWFHYSKRSSSNGSSKRENGEEYLGVYDIPYGSERSFPCDIIGHLPQLIPYTNVIRCMLNWSNGSRGLIRIAVGGTTYAVMNSGPSVQQLLKSPEYGHHVKSPHIYGKMDPFLTNGILTTTGAFWKFQRKVMMKTQTQKALKSYAGLMNRHCHSFVKELETLFSDGKPHEVEAQINVLFLRIVTEIISGYYSNDDYNELKRYHHNFQIWTETLLRRMLSPWLLVDFIWKSVPLYKKYMAAVEEMFDFARQRLHERMRVREAIETGATLDKDLREKIRDISFRSVLDDLLDAEIDEEQILIEINSMMFGGHETGATAIHFFCLCMAANPQVQENCRKEIDEFFNHPEAVVDNEITFDAAQSGLKYVERAIQETLRLYPPVFCIFRDLRAPLVVSDEGKTYLLPTGTTCVVCPYGMHRKEEYFPDPDKFDPDRFLPENVASRHPCVYIPFSAGPRICLGFKLAILQMKIIAAYLLRHFVMTTEEDVSRIELLPYVTMRPEHNFVFTFQKRDVKSKSVISE